MIGIYKITSPTGKIYIGQSINIELRFSYYKRKCCRKQRRLHYSFEKHGVLSHIFSVIEECDIHELNIKERYYQDLFDCIGKNGLNCVLTNTNDKSGHFSNETIIRLSESHKGILKKKKSIIKMKRTILRKSKSKKEIQKKEYSKLKIEIDTISRNIKKRELKKENIDYVKQKIKKPNMSLYLENKRIDRERILNEIRNELKQKNIIKMSDINIVAIKYA